MGGAKSTGLSIQKKTISAQVADAIRQRILSGEYAENMQLRQEHVASELGVSRIPVREALHQLHSEGFVQLASHKSAVVSSVSLDEITELYELRAHIESWLLNLAMSNITEQDLAEARVRAKRHEKNAKNSEQASQLNWEFHSALYSPANRKVTMEMLGRIHRQLERYTRMVVSLTEFKTKSDQDHLQLVELIEKKDAVAAVDLLREHVLTGGSSLVARLKELWGG